MREFIGSVAFCHSSIPISLVLAFTAFSASITVPSESAKTISKALVKTKSGDTVWVEEGVYTENITVPPGVTLASRALLKAVIDGRGSEKAVTLGNNCTITGFVVKGARIGVYSKGSGNTIARCFVRGNQQSGIMCVGHLPRIEDNIIAWNGASGIQGWDVRSTIATINHNTIAYNSNHGVAIGGKSEIVVENCIVASNEKLGVKAEPESRVKLRHNNFFANVEVTGVLPSDNYSMDPVFVAPRKMNLMLAKDSGCRNIAADKDDLGARIIY